MTTSDNTPERTPVPVITVLMLILLSARTIPPSIPYLDSILERRQEKLLDSAVSIPNLTLASQRLQPL